MPVQDRATTTDLATAPTGSSRTADRAVDAAIRAFATHGVAGTSLDDLARTLGVTKQTILYHHGSKAGLVDAVFARAAADLIAVLDDAVVGEELGWSRVDAAVRAAFALAVRRPELVSLLREASRLGPPASDDAVAALRPLVDRALVALTDGMASGRFRRGDPRLVLVTAYAAVTGVVAEPELLRVVEVELDVRTAVRLRRIVLDVLAGLLRPELSSQG